MEEKHSRNILGLSYRAAATEVRTKVSSAAVSCYIGTWISNY